MAARSFCGGGGVMGKTPFTINHTRPGIMFAAAARGVLSLPFTGYNFVVV